MMQQPTCPLANRQGRPGGPVDRPVVAAAGVLLELVGDDGVEPVGATARSPRPARPPGRGGPSGPG